MSAFKKAERRAVKIKLAITGPTGSGKTYSALRLASGLGKKVAVLDTENGSASLYSEHFEFDVLELTPPFTVDKYLMGISDAVKAGYDVLIIDSVTAEWTELLEEKARLDSRPGSNHWTNWGPITKKHNAFINTINNADIHIISTLRSKMEYVQAEENGKKKIQKVGMAPQQRDGIEYEYTVVFDLAMNNEAEVSKDRTGIFFGKIFKITEETGAIILKWLAGAKPAEKKQAVAPPPIATEPPVFNDDMDFGPEPEFDDTPHDVMPEETISVTEAQALYDSLKKQNRKQADFDAYLKKTFDVPTAKLLTKSQYETVKPMVFRE